MFQGSSFLRQALSVLIAAIVSAAVSYIVASEYKPVPAAVMMGARQLTHTEQLRAAAAWGDLDQKEIDSLSEALKHLPKQPLTIFCEVDSKCGDMQLSFDNAFETAHWETKLEKPLIDDTIGVGTSSQALAKAIDDATHGRLQVKLIHKNAPYEVLVIGAKPK